MPNGTHFAFTGSRAFVDAPGSLEVGPVHARRGDSWDVGVRASGEGWPGTGRPTVESDVPIRCSPGPFLDERSDPRQPLVVAWWRCVAEASGEGMVRVSLPGPAAEEVLVLVNVLPSLDVAVGTTLARAAAVLAFGVALAAGLAALATRRAAP